jgi:hypothetical protein
MKVFNLAISENFGAIDCATDLLFFRSDGPALRPSQADVPLLSCTDDGLEPMFPMKMEVEYVRALCTPSALQRCW